MKASSHWYLGWVNWHVAVTKDVLLCICSRLQDRYYNTALTSSKSKVSKLWKQVHQSDIRFFICGRPCYFTIDYQMAVIRDVVSCVG